MSESAASLQSPPPAFDAEAFRAEFPILSREVYGKPLTYLDNAASSQKPRCVIDAMTYVMEMEYANVHRGLHFLSNAATQKYEDARASVARFLKAASSEEIVFTSGGTDAMNLVAAAYLEPRIEAGDEIILSVMEHHSNIVPWHFLRERHGAVLKWVPVTEAGALDMDAYRAAFSPRTKFVAMTHMSNVLGTALPGGEIVDIAHAHGAKVMLDGCQAAAHTPIDVRDLDVDFYILTGHKLFGPTGIGALYGKADLLAEMRPYRGGGEMIDAVTEDAVTYNEPPHRFEAGTPPIIEGIGLGAAVEFIMGLDREAAEAHEKALLAQATDRLRELNWVQIYGEDEGKGAILSFSVEGAHPHDVSQLLDRSGVAVRAGHHCCQPLMARLGVTATARASFAAYNTADDVERFIEGLVKAHSILG